MTSNNRFGFILSFLLRGIAPTDMMRLRKSDITGWNVIVYKRSKTHKEMRVRIEDEARNILNKYEVRDDDRLLPLRKREMQYINRNLKVIGDKAGVGFPLTMYCARHTWATLSRFHNVPISVISSGMGHSEERVTQVYLSEIDTGIVDRYNNKLISSIFG